MGAKVKLMLSDKPNICGSRFFEKNCKGRFGSRLNMKTVNGKNTGSVRFTLITVKHKTVR